MRIDRNELMSLQSSYSSVLKESHDETGSADVTPMSDSKQLKHELMQTWTHLIMGAVQRGELSEGLAARNIDSIVQQMWSDVQPVIDHTWEQAQEAYADMAAHYEQER